MKKSTLILMLFTSLFLFTATTCEDDDVGIYTCEDRLESLSELRITIEDLISASQCGEDFECRYIAFGSKPCGGPWEYLIYSTSIDTLELQFLVGEYNSIENDYNLNCDAVSDCMFVNPPTNLECVNGECIAQ